ncbi:MAG: hypothetical protein WA624_10640 [Methylocella sp.]|nr:MAG: hypothetical protein CR217_08240 [Beijerinckiaceae bacterium]
MGLLDIIQGMKNGPRGQRQPSRSGSGGWTSRIMMALLGLLAYKAFKGGGDQAAPTDSGTPRTPTRRGVAGCRDQSRTAVGGQCPRTAPDSPGDLRH